MSVRPFATLPTIDGYEVIATDTGHPVAHRETLHSANGVAFMLNNAAQSNPSNPEKRQRAMGRAFAAVGGTQRPQQPSESADPIYEELVHEAGINGLGLDLLIP